MTVDVTAAPRSPCVLAGHALALHGLLPPRIYSPGHLPPLLDKRTIRTGSALETTTFSSQSATILVANLLLYVVFFDLNRFYFYCLCMFS